MKIIQKQELKENITLLAAQRNLYSRAKMILGLQMFLSFPIAILATIVAIVRPELKGYVALWGILVVVFDLFVFTPWIKRLRDDAARVQELFDTNVFGLDWSEISVGRKPGPELIHEEAQKHGLTDDDISKLRKWYPVSIDSVPDIFGIIICQRSNVWWDAKMRRKYAGFIRVVLVLIAFGLISYGLYENKDMFDFLAYIVAPLAAAYVFGYRQMLEHGAAADRLDKLKEIIEKIWSDAIDGCDSIMLTANIRALQNQIFEHRRTCPPVFDFIYWLFRDRNEELMNKGVDSILAEISNSKKDVR